MYARNSRARTEHRHATAVWTTAVDILRARGVLHAVRHVSLWTDVGHLPIVVSGAERRAHFSHAGFFLRLVSCAARATADGRYPRFVYSLHPACAHRADTYGHLFDHGGRGVQATVQGLERRILHGDRQ